MNNIKLISNSNLLYSKSIECYFLFVYRIWYIHIVYSYNRIIVSWYSIICLGNHTKSTVQSTNAWDKHTIHGE